MATLKLSSEGDAANSFRFKLGGLIVFSLALMAGAVSIQIGFSREHPAKLEDVFAPGYVGSSGSVHTGSWGELVACDIKLERPEELSADEVDDLKPETWVFKGLKSDEVRALLGKAGLSAEQVAAVCLPGAMREDATGTTLAPSPDFLFSLDAKSHEKLWLGLAGLKANLYYDYPYIFPGDSIHTIYTDQRLNLEDVALLKKLVYANGNAMQVSSIQTLLQKIPTRERRHAMLRALTRQNAVLASLAIKPDTDIEKLASYWGHLPGVRFADVRPLMEAIKALPGGGELSLYNLLPKFVRDRLYTYPLPPKPGDPNMDCHWSTLNFCGETPDYRFSKVDFAMQFIERNYHQISTPSAYGDVVLLINEKKLPVHSATYVADDLVFTKNGANYRQPWMLMHLRDVIDSYPGTPRPAVVYLRRNNT